MRLGPRGIKRIRILLSAILLVLALVFLSLSLLSASNYTDVVYAKLSADADASLSMSAQHLQPSGEVRDDTTLWFNATIRIANPSKKLINLQFISYQAWVRDYMAEDLSGGGNPKIFYSCVYRTISYSPNQGMVGPSSTFSFDVSWYLNSSDSISFQNVKRILNYAVINASHLLNWSEVEWNHFFIFQMLVTGVPTEYYGANSGYLIELPVIRRTQGLNPGVG